MGSGVFIFCILAYFIVLLIVAQITSKNSDNASFYIGNRKSNWLLVAFGMIGTSLSGVTFISVPGTVGSQGFFYFQVVIGYFIGYIVVAYVLLPLYYNLQVTSIYNYLKHRFGNYAYKSGASFFILSRTLGATARLYLVINVLQLFLLDAMGVPFVVTTAIILLMILLYTFQGGVKTIVWTDTLQTSFMLIGLVACVISIFNQLNISFSESLQLLQDKNFTRMFNTDFNAPSHIFKHILGGALITITMTGMDQEMMQKNISVKTLKDSQKNMMSFSVILLFVNGLFLLLGGFMYMYAAEKGITTIGDDLFPTIALQHLPGVIGLIFIIGLISALFPSADGAITALTSSFCIDILGIQQQEKLSEAKQVRTRKIVHLSFAALFFILILAFKWIDNKSIIDLILKIAGYTYGPLLGLFSFAILTKRSLPDNIWIAIIACIAPIITYIVDINSKTWFDGFSLGFLNLGLNGLLVFIGLWIISKRKV